MRIHPQGGPRPEPLRQSSSREAADRRAPAKSSDTSRSSDVAALQGRLAELPEVREEVVAAVRQRLPELLTPEAAARTADAILEG